MQAVRLTFLPSWAMGYSSSWAVLGGEKHGLSACGPIRPVVALTRAGAQPAEVRQLSG